jgi:hypothetical protein
MLTAIISEDVRWIFDRYVLLLNAKLRERGHADESPSAILGAIVAQFLIENQKEILDEYKLYSERRLGKALLRLGFSTNDVTAIDPPSDSTSSEQAPPQADGVLSGTSGGKARAAFVSYAEKFKPYKSDTTAARRVAGGSKILRILAP